MTTSGGSPSEQPGGRFSTALRWARKAPAKRVGAPVGAVALVASGAFGGLAPVPASYDDLKAGQAFETGPLEVTVDRIRAIDTMRPFASPDEGNRLLLVVLKLRNPTSEPLHRNVLTNELEIEVEGAELADEPVRVVRMNDFSTLSEIQPGIDYETGLIYETVGEALPSEVGIGLPTYTWREDSFTPGFFDWKDPELAVRGTFPVKDVPDQPESEPTT